jgi:hypothetical protein
MVLFEEEKLRGAMAPALSGDGGRWRFRDATPQLRDQPPCVRGTTSR